MKYIFFGSPEFATIILEKLINAGFIPEAVVCNPDRPIGRKKIITPPPVKLSIMNKVESIKKRIKIIQPENLQELLKIKPLLLTTNPDILIVAAYSKIIPKEILEIPRLGTIGIHPSLLPKYRGASPIQAAILNDDEETGTTLYLMDEKMDHGPILAQQKLEFSIFNFQFSILLKKLAELSVDLLIDFLQKLEPINNQQLVISNLAKPQNEFLATYTKKFQTEDAFIKSEDLEKAEKEGGEIANEIDRKIRAFYPEPGAYTFINNKRTKLLEAKIIDNKLKLIKIQTEGKTPITLK